MNPSKWTKNYYIPHYAFTMSEHLMFQWPTIWRMKLRERAFLQRIENNK